MRKGLVRTRGATIFLLVSLAGIDSCVPEEIAEPPLVADPVKIEVVSGADQTGFEGETLPERIVARILLNDGTVAHNQEIRLLIVSGEGEVTLATGGTAHGTGAGVVSLGAVDVSWTLGPADQPQRLKIFTPLSGVTPVFVDATVKPREEP